MMTSEKFYLQHEGLYLHDALMTGTTGVPCQFMWNVGTDTAHQHPSTVEFFDDKTS